MAGRLRPNPPAGGCAIWVVARPTVNFPFKCQGELAESISGFIRHAAGDTFAANRGAAAG